MVISGWQGPVGMCSCYTFFNLRVMEAFCIGADDSLSVELIFVKILADQISLVNITQPEFSVSCVTI